MKNFDHKFSEKLYSHKTSPPADLWDKLDSALDAERQEKTRNLYWRVAAAVTLLLLIGSVVWFNIEGTTQTNIAMKSEEKVEPVQELIPEKHNALALQEKMEDAPGLAQDYIPIDNEPVPDEKDESNTNSHPIVSNKMLAQTEKVDQNKDQVVLRNGLRPLKPIGPDLPEIERQVLATVTSLPKTSDPVTVIFKPGNKPDKIQEINKPLELLADLKNSSISFSEIRSAKSELLAKVFNKLDNEFSR